MKTFYDCIECKNDETCKYFASIDQDCVWKKTAISDLEKVLDNSNCTTFPINQIFEYFKKIYEDVEREK